MSKFGVIHNNYMPLGVLMVAKNQDSSLIFAYPYLMRAWIHSMRSPFYSSKNLLRCCYFDVEIHGGSGRVEFFTHLVFVL